MKITISSWSLYDLMLTVVLSFSLGAVMVSTLIADYKALAIEHNCAQYNSTDGSFEWRDITKKEVDDE